MCVLEVIVGAYSNLPLGLIIRIVFLLFNLDNGTSTFLEWDTAF